MREDVEDVPRMWVDDREAVDLVGDEPCDGVEEALLGGDRHEGLGAGAQLLCREKRKKYKIKSLISLNLWQIRCQYS